MRVRPVELAELLKRISRVTYQDTALTSGRQWHLDPATEFGQRLLTEGTYDANAVAAFQQVLRPGDTFVDAGANEGWFSVMAAERVGPQGLVLAVEPQARLWPVINRNFLLNRLNNFVLVPFALGAAEGQTEVILYPSLNTGATSLVAGARTRYRTRQPIGILPLARLCEIHRLSSIRLMKIDVEGFEMEALKGAGDWLGRIEHIFVEMHPPQLQALGTSVEAVERLLQSRGYRPRQIGGVDFWSL